MEGRSDDEQTESYEVGYGKPPKSGRFKKGISGNSSGRPKKPSGFDAKLLRELNSPLTINENGKRKVITKDEGIAKQVINKALSGHVPSMRLVDNWRRQALEKAAEEQRNSPFNRERKLEEPSDEELMLLIRAGREGSAPDDKTSER
jgi:hypothetical protein